MRGTKKNIMMGAQIFTSRQDRRPQDMPIEIHNKYDELFLEKFGWKARSEGVFVAGGDRTSYGTPFFFFPVNGYKFIWSPAIFDLYTSRFNFYNKCCGRI